MKKNISRELLAGSPLNQNDAARLVLECMEESKSLTRTNDKNEIITLIRQIIHKGIQAIKAEQNTVSLEEAAWASVAARTARRPVTLRDLRHYVRRILKVENAAQQPLRSMGVGQCRQILEKAFGGSLHSYRKGRVILHSIFSYGIKQEWCDTNPIDRIEVPRIQEHAITPLSITEVQRLEETARKSEFRDMQLPLQLMLYCGVRPAEVARLIPGDIRWEDNELIIRANTSKTGGGRIIPLRKITRKKARVIAPTNWEERWKALRKAAGFKHWQPDVCRHTFASYHAAFFKDMKLLQMEMGHSDLLMLRTRYISPVTRKDAAVYWASGSGKGRPSKVPGNSIPIAYLPGSPPETHTP